MENDGSDTESQRSELLQMLGQLDDSRIGLIHEFVSGFFKSGLEVGDGLSHDTDADGLVSAADSHLPDEDIAKARANLMNIYRQYDGADNAYQGVTITLLDKQWALAGYSDNLLVAAIEDMVNKDLASFTGDELPRLVLTGRGLNELARIPAPVRPHPDAEKDQGEEASDEWPYPEPPPVFEEGANRHSAGVGTMPPNSSGYMADDQLEHEHTLKPVTRRSEIRTTEALLRNRILNVFRDGKMKKGQVVPAATISQQVAADSIRAETVRIGFDMLIEQGYIKLKINVNQRGFSMTQMGEQFIRGPETPTGLVNVSGEPVRTDNRPSRYIDHEVLERAVLDMFKREHAEIGSNVSLAMMKLAWRGTGLRTDDLIHGLERLFKSGYLDIVFKSEITLKLKPAGYKRMNAWNPLTSIKLKSAVSR